MRFPALPFAVAASLFLSTLASPACAAEKNDAVYVDPAKADEDFPFQGEYSGQVGGAKVGVQVVALGKGTFEGVICEGGLPGDGWDLKKNPREKVKGQRDGGKVTFNSPPWQGRIEGGKLIITGEDGKERGTLEKVARKSPTLGAKPPEGAVVLFDETKAAETVKNFQGGKLSEDGLLTPGVNSTQKFGDCTMHLEFLLPYMPEARGQGRGNSGSYLQGRYEVQILDSFGLTGENNECGGIYTIAKPRLNMCFPPLSWQTYDIDYTAAKYSEGKVVSKPKITVKHNGELIHDNVELTHATTSSVQPEGPEPGPLHLQNHGTPVRYRNIWVVEKK